MRVLITGSSGFVGKHLIKELVKHGHEPLALDLVRDPNLPLSIPYFSGDILDAEMLRHLVASTRPDACVHLSGLAFVPESWRNPDRALSVNILGTVHLLEAFRKSATRAHVLIISTAHVYGSVPREHPLTENDLLNPETPYAVSKAAADHLALLYTRQHGMHTMTARPFNHIGPGQSPLFVVPTFAEQLLAISRHQAPPALKVGNLENRHDFTDVRDVARAYRLLIESGKAGQAYNIASGHSVSIQEIMDQLCRIIGVKPAVETDSSRFRPSEQQAQISIEKILTDVGWKPEIPIATTLKDIVAELTGTIGAN